MVPHRIYPAFGTFFSFHVCLFLNASFIEFRHASCTHTRAQLPSTTPDHVFFRIIFSLFSLALWAPKPRRSIIFLGPQKSGEHIAFSSQCTHSMMWFVGPCCFSSQLYTDFTRSYGRMYMCAPRDSRKPLLEKEKKECLEPRKSLEVYY